MEKFSKFIFKKYIHGVARDDTVAKRDCDFPIGLSRQWGYWEPNSDLYRGLTPSFVFHGHMHIYVQTYTHIHTHK